jgi:hypothetical protein
MNYVYGAAGAIVLLVAVFFGGYHFGKLAPQLAEAKTEIRQEAAEDVKVAKDQTTVAEEAKTYEAATDPALTPVIAPRLSVCYYAPLQGHASGSGADAKPPVRAPDPPNPVPGPDIGRPLVQISHNADAQIAGLQDYISKVCQAKP